MIALIGTLLIMVLAALLWFFGMLFGIEAQKKSSAQVLHGAAFASFALFILTVLLAAAGWFGAGQ